MLIAVESMIEMQTTACSQMACHIQVTPQSSFVQAKVSKVSVLEVCLLVFVGRE